MTRPRPRGAHPAPRAREGAIFWAVAVLLVVGPAESRCGHCRPGRPISADSSHRGTDGRNGSLDARGLRGISRSIHVALGVPADADRSDDYLLDERAYVASYNPVKRVPNWVSWKLERSDLGNVPRRESFRADPLLPDAYYRVTSADYRGTGYDRGHLCPSADRTASPKNNQATFLMTNIQPQIHELNAGPWAKLEEHARELARRPGARLFIVAGGIFDERPRTIRRKVAIPRANYKVIVALDRNQSARDVTEETPIIAALMPNQRGAGARAWTDYLTSVDEIERLSGYDVLSRLPDPIEQVLEARDPTPPPEARARALAPREPPPRGAASATRKNRARGSRTGIERSR